MTDGKTDRILQDIAGLRGSSSSGQGDAPAGAAPSAVAEAGTQITADSGPGADMTAAGTGQGDTSLAPPRPGSASPTGDVSGSNTPTSGGLAGPMTSLPPAPAGMGVVPPDVLAGNNAQRGNANPGSIPSGNAVPGNMPSGSTPSASGPVDGGGGGKSDAASGAGKDKVDRLPGYPFPVPEAMATQEGEYGLRYDFNHGIRIMLPQGDQWKVRFWDMETDTCLHESKNGGEYVCSRKKYFIRGMIELFENDKLVWTHEYNARGRKVAIIMPVGTLGDPLGWVPYADRFRQEHDCELTVVVSKVIIELMGPLYPEIRFICDEEFEALRGEFYATYYVGLFFHDEGEEWQPRDFRDVGLHRTAAWILGLENKEEIRPRVVVEEPDTPPVEEPYVVVAVQASCACKMWHNPLGWLDTVAYLKKMGYRVICIDKHPVVGDSIHWNAVPNGAEDETGPRALAERARWLKHAEFFVGLSSGLSWLAWAVETPVVMISGFTNPRNEFHTPYRVFSNHGCNSCWHDIRTPFKHDDYLFCPRHKGTSRAFECTRIINTSYVVSTIKRLCRDHGYHPPILRGKDGLPVDEEKAGEMEKDRQTHGMELKHELYWEL